jgi:cytochrome c-type biogenesis protein CcmH/NrfG
VQGLPPGSRIQPGHAYQTFGSLWFDQLGIAHQVYQDRRWRQLPGRVPFAERIFKEMIPVVRTIMTLPHLALIFCMLLCQASAHGAVDAATKGQVRQLLKQANEEISVGQPEAAFEHLRAVLTADPGNPDAHYLMGRVKFSAGAISEAEEILTQGMELAPLSSRIKLLLARVKLAQENPDEADRLVSDVLAIKPHDAEALYLAGSVALARGDSTLTLARWQEALAVELGDELP